MVPNCCWIQNLFFYVLLIVFRILDTTKKMAHTILLVQPGAKPESRTYTDYESVNECMEVNIEKSFDYL